MISFALIEDENGRTFFEDLYYKYRRNEKTREIKAKSGRM